MYTIEKDFSEKIIGRETLRAYGYDYNINYSSLLSQLIFECGRFCEQFSSDLFYDWKGIQELLDERLMGTSTYLFGIRRMGVDSKNFILARYNENGERAFYSYEKIYRLDVETNNGEIAMKLYEIEKPFKERG